MYFLTECNPDVVLIQKLSEYPKRNIIHSGNKSRVLYDLIYKHTNSIGMIDEDPGKPQPPLLSNFNEIEESPIHYIKLLYNHKSKNHLIILRPRLEEWIIRASRIAGLDIRKFSLPNDADRLHSIININLNKFEKLLESLVAKSEQLSFLRSLLII